MDPATPPDPRRRDLPPATGPRRWVVEHTVGPAPRLHDRSWPDPMVPTVWVQHVDRPALVLGSAQRDEVVDRRAVEGHRVTVARRRSGGGAVLLEPGASTWIDVLIPADDARWDDDVGRAFLWLGEVWAEAAGAVGLDEVAVHRGPVRRTRWSDLVCFAGLGVGEVTVEGAKLVGMSQRRRRVGARFQCIVHHAWHPDALLDLLDLAPEDRAAADRDLAGTVACWPGPSHQVVSALLAALGV